MKKINKNMIFTIIIFLVFFLILLFQHQFMYLYHDDYGYASLSYAYNVKSAEGTDLNISQIIEFLNGHYNIWGGRVLYFFFEIILLSTGTWLFRFMQSVVITLIFFIIFKIIKKTFEKNEIPDWLIAICSIICYGFIEIMLFRDGVFWPTASILYLFPLLPFLIFIYIYQDGKNKKYKTKGNKILFYIVNILLVILATFSQEQISVAVVGYVVILTIYNWIKTKKNDKIDVIMCIVSLLSFAVLMLAPGNEIRRAHPTSINFYSMPFIKRILTGIKVTIVGNFSSNTSLFNILFYIVILYFSVMLIKNKKGIKICNYASLTSIIAIIIITSIKRQSYFEYIYELCTKDIFKLIAIALFMMQLGLMAYSVIVYLFSKEKYKLINIFISSILSQACMIMAPYFPLRSAMIFQILNYILILYALFEVYSTTKNKSIVYCILVPIICISILNIGDITKGYYLNSGINKQNDIALKSVSEKIKNGEDIKDITLKKLPDILYSTDQPYIEGRDYILYYMKEYYNLPDDFIINYE